MSDTSTNPERSGRVFFPMFPRFVLGHSPLVGPFSWQPVAGELQREGYRTVVPSLLSALQRSWGFGNAIAQRVNETVNQSGTTGPLILVAHSAAGAFLPAIASRLDRQIKAYVFVDARLPRRGASLADEDSARETQARREMARDGMLPPWSEWFEEEAVKAVIPNHDRRQRFLAELQPIPLALFDEKIPFDSDWPDAPCGYVRLSEFYRPMAQEAAALGWSVLEVDAHHLYLLTDPIDATGLLLDIVARLEAR